MPHVGSVLEIDPGKWSGRPALTVSWRRNGIPIPGETAGYQLVRADVGKMISVVVHAHTPGGNAIVGSNLVGPILEAAP